MRSGHDPWHLCIAIAATIVACAPSPPTGTLTQPHRVAIIDSVNAMLLAWRDAIAQKRADSAAAFYSDSADFRWFEDGNLRYSSRAEVAKAITEMNPGVRAIDFALTDANVTPLAPGIATLSAGFLQKFRDTLGGIGGYAGAVTATVVHASSGWKFLLGHTSALRERGRGSP